jgi:lipid II:glycine glycyltransferase (peptidoglycan interpeptide bridge formation enzyme)
LLIRAESARVSLILGSTAAFRANGEPATVKGFEEAMYLYEEAIDSARKHGFSQYEALG